MKNDHKTIWNCCITGRPTGVLHEIIPGRGNRSICEKYNIQVPVSHEIHLGAHGRLPQNHIFTHSQEWYKRKFCELLGIPFETTQLAVRDKSYRYFLESIKDGCLEKLRSWEA